ncbi:MAG: ABC-F family ATP-binding cassette domain-containing protein [Clostridia bacterium]|nr:ABC-F family ATP-binding cassette domain-containing protein [Clostridia bacterium]
MISISASNLCFRVGARDILTGVNFSLEDGDRLAIVGVNGSGKSTLMRLITGEYTADEGAVYIAKDKTVGMLEQDDAFHILRGEDGSPISETVLGQMYAAFPELCRMEARLAQLEEQLKTASGEELTYLSAEFASLNTRFAADGGLHYKSRCRSFLVHLGFPEEFHNMPIEKCSGGQRTRLALARLLSREPDILLLDEPTNHLDTDTMVWLEEHLANYKKTLLLVSHDRYFLDRVTNKTLDIEHHTAKLYKASYTEYLKLKAEDRAAQERKYINQQKEIARQEAYIAQQRQWNRERNIIAAESREKALARMEKVERPQDAPKSIRFTFTESGESGSDVLAVKKLAKAFPGKVLFRDLSFEVKKRDRLFILGPNGCGKSTLIKILLEQLHADAGRIEFGYNVSVGYYDQENQNLDERNTVLEELWSTYPTLTQTEIRNTLALFLFRGDDIEKTVSVLSGGERARLTLAKLILSRMNLLILDEPTNHLDIQSREALETALSDFDGTIVAVSHDRYFTSKLATRILALSPEGAMDFRGTYEGYKEDCARRAGGPAAAVQQEKVSSGKEEYLARKQEAARLRQRQKRRQTIGKDIEKLEKRLVEIQDELFGEAASDYKRAAELEDERITTEDLLMQLYEEEEDLAKGD